MKDKNRLEVTRGNDFTSFKTSNEKLLFKYAIQSDNGDVVCRIMRDDGDDSNVEAANASLICDSFATYNQCGLLPSELLERTKKLEKDNLELIEQLETGANQYGKLFADFAEMENKNAEIVDERDKFLDYLYERLNDFYREKIQDFRSGYNPNQDWQPINETKK